MPEPPVHLPPIEPLMWLEAPTPLAWTRLAPEPLLPLEAPPAMLWPHQPPVPSLEPHLFWTPEPAGLPGLRGEEPRGALARLRPEQGTPEDSLFRRAREALNAGEYNRAHTMFESLLRQYPRSRVAPAAFYWSAFSLYRSGAPEELRTALSLLQTQKERYPEAAADADVEALRVRLYAALAARGDAQAATALRAASAQGGSCDREEMQIRADALNALARLNPAEARPTLKRVLARRDECSVTLRRQAVYILGRSGTEEAAADLLEAAKSDPDPSVRSDAITLIGRSPGTQTVRILEQLFNESADERTRQAVLAGFRAKGTPEARRILRSVAERADLSERIRVEAIQQLGRAAEPSREVTAVESPGSGARPRPGPTTRVPGDEEEAAFLRGLYGRTDSRPIKSAILSAVARIGGANSERWLLDLAKNRGEESSLRREALSRIHASALSIEELGRLFDALSERELRYAVVNQLASRDDTAAVDKLIEIARSGTDPQVRRYAINALTRKNDPRTTRLLLELVEKP